MSEYGSDWDDDDGEYGRDHDAKDVDPEKEPELSNDFDQDYDPFECPDYDKGDPGYDPFKCPDYDNADPEYDPFKYPDYDKGDPEYDPFTPPDLTLKDDDSKEYDPFTPPDLTLEKNETIEAIEEDVIKENEPEFTEEKSIDHEITFDHIYEKDIEEIVKDIDQAEELHAIYAEDIMIPSGEKEAIEQYYMEQMKAEGVIITNDLYFEETPEKKQATLDHFNEPTTNSINREKEQLNKELDSTTKANFTEIDGKEISLTNDIEYENEVHESIEVGKEINEQQEENQIQEEKNLDISKSEVKDIDKGQEILQKYSSGQYATHVLKQVVETLTNQEPQEIKEENLNHTEEIRQDEVKKTLTSEVTNEVDKKKISQEIEKNQINSGVEKGINEIISEKTGFDHKINEQEVEIKEKKREEINKEIDLKEEWEKTLIEWIKGVKDEDLSPEKKVELIEFMRKYRNAREEHTRFHYLNVQHKKNEVSEEEKQERIYLRKKIKEYDEIDEEMFKELHAFRCFCDYNKKRWYDTVINSKKKGFPNLVPQKLERLKSKRFKKTKVFQEQNFQELSKEISNEIYELLKKRYHQETGGNAIYGGKETKGFKRWKEDLNEIPEEVSEEISEPSHEVKGEWADALKSHIHDISDEEISQEIKDEMTNVIDNYNNLQKTSKNLPPNLRHVVEELRQFQATYIVYEERGYEKSISREISIVAKKLRKILELIKNEAILGIVLNGSKRILQNIKEIIRENLYKSTMSLNEKSTINKIIQKEKLTKQEKEELILILSKLHVEEFNSILGSNVNDFIRNQAKGFINQAFNTKKGKTRLRHQDWSVIIHEIKNIYENSLSKWNIEISGDKLDNLISKLINNIQQKVSLKMAGYEYFINFSDFHPQSKKFLINLIRLTPRILDQVKIRVTDLYRLIDPSARTIPRHYREKLVLFFDEINDFYNKFRIHPTFQNRENYLDKDTENILTISGNLWIIVIQQLIQIYEHNSWIESINNEEVEKMIEKLFNTLKQKGNQNLDLFWCFRDCTRFNGNNVRILRILIPMVPLILNDISMNLVDLYRITCKKKAKDLPHHLREYVKLFFDSDEDYREKFNLKTLEDYYLDYELLAQERDWELLSDEYISQEIGLDFKCLNCGHEWHADHPNRLIYHGHGCPSCSQRLKYNIEDMKIIAEERGGKCLSNEYYNNRTKLLWKCGICGHEWRATPKSIMIRDSWCPQCAEGLYERMCRAFFEVIFRKEFKKSCPSWLVTEDGYQMHLDGYNKELKIAFEYQGEQHYRFIKYFHKTEKRFRYQQRLDERKKFLCKEKGVILILIGFNLKSGRLHKVRFDEMEEEIRIKCIENEIFPPDETYGIDWKSLDVSPPDTIKEMQELAEERGGMCLSKKYFGDKVKLKWKCSSCNHEWKAIPHNVKQGSWCPQCANKAKSESKKEYWNNWRSRLKGNV